MTTHTTSRVLFLDDSGKPSAKDNSQVVMIGGFSIPSEHVPALGQRISDAKALHFSRRGSPANWELKASQLIRPNPMRRRNNRRLILEVIQCLVGLDCTVYSVSIDKRNLHHAMHLDVSMPLQFRVLAEHFAAECSFLGETGLIVSDRSSDSLDALVSRSIASFVTGTNLPLHPSVYFADSLSSQAIQVADIVAGTRRRTIEGDTGLREIDSALGSICMISEGDRVVTIEGRQFNNQVLMI